MRLELTSRAVYLACLPALALAAYLLRTGAPPSPALAREPIRRAPAPSAAPEAPPPADAHEVHAAVEPTRIAAPVAAAVIPQAPERATSRISIELASESELRALTWLLPEDVVLGLTKRSETSYELEASAVSWLFEHGPAVLSGMSLEWPSAENPSIVLLEIRPDSIADRLGFEAGDRLTAFDGVAPASEQAVADALHSARERGRLELELERSGERWLVTLTTSAAGSPRTPLPRR